MQIQPERLRRLLAERRLALVVTDEALAHIAEEGYDPVYGARPLKRVLQRRLMDPLAMKMLEGSVSDGDTVTVDLREGDLVFSVGAAAEAVTAS